MTNKKKSTKQVEDQRGDPLKTTNFQGSTTPPPALPTDIWQYIPTFLDAASLLILQRVSKWFRNTITIQNPELKQEAGKQKVLNMLEHCETLSLSKEKVPTYQDAQGNSAIHIAAMLADQALIQQCLKVDPDGMSRENAKKKLPLHIALEGKNIRFVKYMIEQQKTSAERNSNADSFDLDSAALVDSQAVRYAEQRGNPDIAVYLKVQPYHKSNSGIYGYIFRNSLVEKVQSTFFSKSHNLVHAFKEALFNANNPEEILQTIEAFQKKCSDEGLNPPEKFLKRIKRAKTFLTMHKKLKAEAEEEAQKAIATPTTSAPSTLTP